MLQLQKPGLVPLKLGATKPPQGGHSSGPPLALQYYPQGLPPFSWGWQCYPQDPLPLQLGLAVLPLRVRPLLLGLAVLAPGGHPPQLGLAVLPPGVHPLQLGLVVLPLGVHPLQLGLTILTYPHWVQCCQVSLPYQPTFSCLVSVITVKYKAVYMSMSIIVCLCVKHGVECQWQDGVASPRKFHIIIGYAGACLASLGMLPMGTCASWDGEPDRMLCSKCT